MCKLACVVAAVGAALWLAVHYLMPQIAGMLLGAIALRDAESVGIIGGADGPTAIFVAAQSGRYWLQDMLALLILGGGIAGFCLLRKEKRK